MFRFEAAFGDDEETLIIRPLPVQPQRALAVHIPPSVYCRRTGGDDEMPRRMQRADSHVCFCRCGAPAAAPDPACAAPRRSRRASACAAGPTPGFPAAAQGGDGTRALPTPRPDAHTWVMKPFTAISRSPPGLILDRCACSAGCRCPGVAAVEGAGACCRRRHGAHGLGRPGVGAPGVSVRSRCRERARTVSRRYRPCRMLGYIAAEGRLSSRVGS